MQLTMCPQPKAKSFPFVRQIGHTYTLHFYSQTISKPPYNSLKILNIKQNYSLVYIR